jgi:uncharacterized protein DUF4242
LHLRRRRAACLCRQRRITDDKIYCVYIAPDAEMVRTHADKGGFPANSIARVRSVIDPATADWRLERDDVSSNRHPALAY